MDGTKVVAAWKEWIFSEEGRMASDPGTLPAISIARTPLEKRLEKAFQAGLRFGANAVADDVIAAMEKEKSS